ncbi:MAG: HAD-IA family hydrolase [Chromatocurvus sp.]
MKHPGEALRAVILDLDGTLVDTADDFVPVVQTLRAEHALPSLPAASIRNTVSNGARALVTLALDLREGDSEFQRWLDRLLDLYAGILGTHSRLFPGVQTLLDALRHAGLPWGIATNKPSRFTLPLLEKLALTPPPASVVCADQVSRGKPDPECLLRNSRELQCEPAQAIYIGDHGRDIEAGRNAGMFTIAATYGYIGNGDNPDLWGADASARDGHDLAALVFNTAARPSANA